MDKIAQGEVFNSTRELIKYLNEEKIKREDIVSVLMPALGQVFLIYYK